MRKTNKIYKNIIKTAVVMLPLVLGTSSCKKNLLNPVPTTSILDTKAFDTPQRILSQVNGLYAAMKSGQYRGGRFIIYDEIRGEEFIVNKPNGVTGLDTWNQNVSSSTNEVINLWSAIYTTINRCNVFLAGLAANASKVDATTAATYTGEAELIRALCYYDLVQMYARPYTADNGASLGVPLRLVAETDLTGAGTNDLARSTVAQVYTQIIKDLNDAETKLPATQVNGAYRAYKNTAIALKTRIYLAQANYASVVTEASKIISVATPAAKLENNIATVFSGTYAGGEALLFLPFTTTDAPGTQNQLGYYFTSNPGNGEYYLNPSGIYANPALSSTTSTDARKSFVTKVGTVNYLTKYKQPSPFTDNVPVVRYAETILNYAEAAARTGDLASATALVTAVRKRSDPTYTFAAADVGTQSALVNTILTERRIELLGEGFRTPDLMRQLLPLPAKSGPQGSSPAVAPTASNYIWPISGIELQNNKLIVPNP